MGCRTRRGGGDGDFPIHINELGFRYSLRSKRRIADVDARSFPLSACNIVSAAKPFDGFS